MGQALVSLGFSLKLPEGYMAKLYPRSSTFKTWGIIQTNHVAIIDNSYCGNEDVYMYPCQCTMAKQTEKVMINGHKVIVSGTWIKKVTVYVKWRYVKFHQLLNLMKQMI